MTCIGNSGPLDESVANAIEKNELVCCGVLSGNRNFEGRIHPSTRANYLASPLLVIAYALGKKNHNALVVAPSFTTSALSTTISFQLEPLTLILRVSRSARVKMAKKCICVISGLLAKRSKVLKANM